MSDDAVIVLRKYSSEVEATMAHLVLEAHNIPSAVMRDTAGGMIPSMALLYTLAQRDLVAEGEARVRVCVRRGAVTCGAALCVDVRCLAGGLGTQAGTDLAGEGVDLSLVVREVAADELEREVLDADLA